VTGEDVTLEELGGAMSHATKSGVAAFVSPDEKSCLDDVRYLLSFLPSNNLEEAPLLVSGDDPERLTPELTDLMPASPNQPYDMKKVIEAVVDEGEFFEVNHHWAMNLVCGFARIDGRSVGIVGNQPQMLAGVLNIDASEKGARFVRTCDAFNIPLITFVDVPGFMPGTDQEYGGIIRHGAKLLYAYCESTVPRVQIITRKAYGGAYVVMNSKSIGADLAYAWPSPNWRSWVPRVPLRSSTVETWLRPPTRLVGARSWSRSTPSGMPILMRRPSEAMWMTSSTRPRHAACWCGAWPFWCRSVRICPSASTGTCRYDRRRVEPGGLGDSRPPEIETEVLAVLAAAIDQACPRPGCSSKRRKPSLRRGGSAADGGPGSPPHVATDPGPESAAVRSGR